MNGRDTLESIAPLESFIPLLVVSAMLMYQLFCYLRLSPGSISGFFRSILDRLLPQRLTTALSSFTASLNLKLRDDTRPVAQTTKGDGLKKMFGSYQKAFISAAQSSGVLPSRTAFHPTTIKSWRPPGLGNWDNSCYQNSVLQGLASLPSLSSFLTRVTSNRESSSEQSTPTAISALRDILQSLNDPFNGGRRLWTPSELKSMSSWQQQDAQEYFSKVLDEVDRTISLTLKRQQADDGLKFFSNPTESQHSAQTPDSKKPEPSASPNRVSGQVGRLDEGKPSQHLTTPSLQSQITRNPLEGLLAQRVGCMRCGWSEGLSMIPFTCLTVPLGRDATYDVKDCLDKYTELEAIEGVECAKCTLIHAREQTTALLKRQPVRDGVSEGSDGQERLNKDLYEAIRIRAGSRLDAIDTALEDEDYSESTLSKKCGIPSKGRVTTTKSRQAVIARAPDCLAVHVNRSVFDEYTGIQRKNYSRVLFEPTLDLGRWCLGSFPPSNAAEDGSEREEKWVIDPAKSMIPAATEESRILGPRYEIRSVITHYGRHENGHYICYRKCPSTTALPMVTESCPEDDSLPSPGQWWQISDDDVAPASEQEVLNQGGVFMLLYERIDDVEPAKPCERDSSSPQPQSSGVEDHLSMDTTDPATPVSIREEALAAVEVEEPFHPSTSPLSPPTIPEIPAVSASHKKVANPSDFTNSPLTRSDVESKTQPIVHPHLRPMTPRSGHSVGSDHGNKPEVLASSAGSAMVMAN